MKRAFKKAFEVIFSHNDYFGEIISTTLYMTITSSIVALLIGVPIGLLIINNEFKGKSILVTITQTFMGLPPVAVGIFMFMLFSNAGPFGYLRLIYSVPLMILSQIVLITPIVVGMMINSIQTISNNLFATSKGLGIKAAKRYALLFNEGKWQILAIYLFAFARAMSEVGAIQIVGGNILHKTRVMTTTIALNYGSGDFAIALALGIVLICITLTAHLLGYFIQKWAKK